MLAEATVRVKAQDPAAGSRPCQEDLERAAELLRGRGIEVIRIGRYGVSVRADEAVFERELGVAVKAGEPLVADPRPRDAALAVLIDLVEVAGRPTPAGHAP